jgi:UDP-N-acetylmuramyl pentapeptide phosphotransferase/UDP-N-acetylglucosamine-1-phosphate transferase
MPAAVDSMALWLSAGLAIVAVAAAATAALIAVMLPSLQKHALARPNARSTHRVPTPQGGGIALVSVATATAAIAALVIPGLGATELGELLAVLLAAILLGSVGAMDDMRSLPTWPRLLAQTIAVGIVIAALPAELRLTTVLPWWIERAAFLIAGVWMINLVNFMDGIDWMTAAEIVPVGIGLFVLGLIGALPAAGTILALALLGSTIGFAYFNRPVARLFLGDAGSLPIGLMLFWLLLPLAARGHVAAALLLPLYYLADATLTLLRRLATGQPFWQAHRTHFYQRAVDRGLSVPAIVARVFVLNVALAALAVVSVAVPQRAVGVAAFAFGGALVGGLILSFARDRQ